MKDYFPFIKQKHVTPVTTCENSQKTSKIAASNSDCFVTYIEETTRDTCDKNISSQFITTEKSKPVTAEAAKPLLSHASHVVTPSSTDYLPEYTLQQCNEVMLRHMNYYCTNLGVNKRIAFEMATEIYKQVQHSIWPNPKGS